MVEQLKRQSKSGGIIDQSLHTAGDKREIKDLPRLPAAISVIREILEK